MLYLDHGATSFPKPKKVLQATAEAMAGWGNPGRGDYGPAMQAAQGVFRCRELAGMLFHCLPEQVVFTGNCTQGLNMAIRTIVRPGMKVVISGFEHNAVTRTLRYLGANVQVAGRTLFQKENTLKEFEKALAQGAKAAVFTQVSNVFGYRLPSEEMAWLCRKRHIPFIIDAAQSAGMMSIDFQKLGADFIAMPGHKGLLGPMGTGMLLCGRLPDSWLTGGTGSESAMQTMPAILPDRGEAGTLNVPGIAGLAAGIEEVLNQNPDQIGQRETEAARQASEMLRRYGMEVFRGDDQSGTVSFRCGLDCEEAGRRMEKSGVALRTGLHCAPLAHQSAGTLQTGTIRLSFGWDWQENKLDELENAVKSQLPAADSHRICGKFTCY